MKFYMSLTALLLTGAVYAQTPSAQVERNGKAPLTGTINLSDPQLRDWDPYVFVIGEQKDAMAEFGGEEKPKVNEMRRQFKAAGGGGKGSQRAGTAAMPVMLNNFTANNAQGTPNDNHIAISNAGKIVSVVNTNFRVYNEAGTQLQTKSLSLFATSLGLLASISDPRVVYDPVADKFIVVFFAGNTSVNTRIIVAFSQTNDPAGVWNLYSLNGNPLNDTTWSDYPIVVTSDKDLFMTFNNLEDGYDWKTGFRYSGIWQIDKQRGYNGDTLQYDFWHDIKYNGKPIWNVCAVHSGSAPTGPETYFLSVRPSDISNDTVFLHTISDSYQSGNAQFSTKVLKTNLPYGLPPSGAQKDGQYLATNDARILDGFVENNKIQYVQNTVDPQNMMAGVYVGEVDNPASATPTATGQIISYDTIDLGYPSITYMGNNAFDNRAMITCSFSSPDTFPGTCAFYKDANGNISDMLIIKKGEDAVNVLGDTTERWGDYTGIQRKYNEPNTAWLAGSYVYPTNAYRTWIAKVANPDSSVVSSVNTPTSYTEASVYPNPTAEKFTVDMELPEGNFVKFALYDNSGKLVRVLMEDKCEGDLNRFSFNTQYLSTGVYFLRVTNRNTLLHTAKVVIKK